MAKRINVVGKAAKRIEVIGKPQRRIDPEEFARAFGAEPCGEPISADMDPISLAELGTELLKRLRSTGGRPSLADATEHCKVPLSPEDLAALGRIINAVELKTGTKPSLGQIASVILHHHLDSLSNAANGSTPDKPGEQDDLAVLRELIDEQIKPVREELGRVAKKLRGLSARRK